MNSIVGSIGGWHDAVYAATKGAGSALTKALAIDEAHNGVRVNGILPGNVMTETRMRLEMAEPDPAAFHRLVETTQWMGRSAQPREIGSVALFPASDAAAFVTGADYLVTGGIELGTGPKGSLRATPAEKSERASATT